MKSSTQKPISIESIVKIVHHNFGEETKVGEVHELSDGWWSVAYSVDFPEKDFDIIIKLNIPDSIQTQIYEFKAMETEINVLKFIKNHPIGEFIPLPELIAYDIEGNLVGRGYFITKKFKGNPLSQIRKKIPKPELAKIETEIGKLQAKINEITGDKFGYFIDHPQFPVQTDSWASTFSLMMENLLNDCKVHDTTLPFNQEKVRELLKMGEKALNKVKKPSLVHWDLWTGNIFVKKVDNKWELEGIIDFERAIWGDPLTESSLRGKKKNENLIKGYGTDIFSARDAKIRDAFYDLYLGTTLFVERSFRKYKPAVLLMYRLYCRTFWKPALKYLSKELLND